MEIAAKIFLYLKLRAPLVIRIGGVWAFTEFNGYLHTRTSLTEEEKGTKKLSIRPISIAGLLGCDGKVQQGEGNVKCPQ